MAPVEERVDDDRVRDVRAGIGIVHRTVGIVEAVREAGLAPVDLAGDLPGVRVEQELRRMTTDSLHRVVRAVHPVAVVLARPDPGQIPVPHLGGPFGQFDARLDAVVVDQAQIDPLGGLGEDGEVGPGTVEGRAERGRVARPEIGVRVHGGGGTPCGGPSNHRHERSPSRPGAAWWGAAHG